MSEREQSAFKIVARYVWWSMGAGLVPLPFLDLAAVSAVQLKMLAEVSKTYDIPFRENRVKALAGSLVGSIMPHAMSFGLFGSVLKAVPIVGVFAGAPSMVLWSGAATWALGNVFIQHFESGGTFLDFHPEEVKAQFRSQFEYGKKMVTRQERAAGPA